MEVSDSLRDALYGYDPAAPLDEQRSAAVEREGVVEERFSFRGAWGRIVPGVLVRPAITNGPVPAIIVQHGLNAGKDDRRIDVLRRAWAATGIACATIDAPRHGERAEGSVFEVLGLLALPYAGLQYVQQTVIDLRRLVDLLRSRPEIDGGRLGYLGFSMSTFLGVQFVAVEPRIRVAGLAMGGAGLFHFLAGRAPAAARTDQDLVARLIDPLHYAARIAPRPVLQVNGTRDQVVPAALGHMLQSTLAEPKRMLWYDGGHGELPRDTAEEMHGFFAQALGVPTEDGA